MILLTTHALAGMALALPVAAVTPEFGGVALVSIAMVLFVGAGGSVRS